jgi:hypothetical protein
MMQEFISEPPLSLEDYLIDRQKRKDEGLFVFSYIDIFDGNVLIKRIDYDEAYKSMIDNTTNEDATSNKP